MVNEYVDFSGERTPEDEGKAFLNGSSTSTEQVSEAIVDVVLGLFRDKRD